MAGLYILSCIVPSLTRSFRMGDNLFKQSQTFCVTNSTNASIQYTRNH